MPKVSFDTSPYWLPSCLICLISHKDDTYTDREAVSYTHLLAAVQTANANVNAAQAEVETAKLLYESKKILFAENVVSEFDLSTAKNSLAVAEAALEQAKAQLTDAKNSLSYTEIKSPSDGVVGTLPYRLGALVDPSMPLPLTTISDNARMVV